MEQVGEVGGGLQVDAAVGGGGERGGFGGGGGWEDGEGEVDMCVGVGVVCVPRGTAGGLVYVYSIVGKRRVE